MAAVRVRLNYIRVTVGKAATQLLVPCVLTLSCSILLLVYGWAAWWPVHRGSVLARLGAAGAAAEGGVPGAALEGGQAGEGGGGGGPGDASLLWVFLARYFGWWACLVWSVCACCTLLIKRVGLDAA